VFVLSHISKTTRPNFTKFFYACCLWPWLGPFLAALRYVMYFRFVYDIMGLWRVTCNRRRNEEDGVKSETTAQIPTKLCSSSVAHWGRSLLSMISWSVQNFSVKPMRHSVVCCVVHRAPQAWSADEPDGGRHADHGRQSSRHSALVSAKSFRPAHLPIQGNSLSVCLSLSLSLLRYRQRRFCIYSRLLSRAGLRLWRPWRTEKK